jgi:hypothetical protein
MIETPTHPAASTEFLSKRHDGDLSAADLAAFEAHRRECPECAAAVVDFDRALAAFRAAEVAPAASDISARILRKIRAASPSRRPFGVMFGIDVRWAGALAAALLVVIIMTPVFRRPPARVASATEEETPKIAAYILDAEASRDNSTGPPVSEPPARQKKESDSARDALAPAPAAPSTLNDLVSLEAAPDEAAAAAGPRSNAAAAPAAPPAAQAPPAPAPPAAAARADARAAAPQQFSRRESTAAPLGGEAGAEGFVDDAPEIRVSVRAVDGQGGAPEVVRTPTEASLADLKGREFLLVVESGGKVRFVEERLRERKHDGEDRAAPLEKSKDSRYAAEEILKQFAFHPGDRSRRLVLNVE